MKKVGLGRGAHLLVYKRILEQDECISASEVTVRNQFLFSRSTGLEDYGSHWMLDRGRVFG